ncbi:MAG: DUF3343 domain-containing protein [Firmicutes bacterium]|jgi:hypothetical protein|nr:DUF3343 domain-containing protein [Bacillota bacterium]
MKTIILFHTHTGALKFDKILKKNNIESVLRPVPRHLSSSCGVCIFTDSDLEGIERIDEIKEVVFED